MAGSRANIASIVSVIASRPQIERRSRGEEREDCHGQEGCRGVQVRRRPAASETSKIVKISSILYVCTQCGKEPARADGASLADSSSEDRGGGAFPEPARAGEPMCDM